MNQKNDFWNENNESEAPFENKEEKALATPETYYHESESESNQDKKEDRYYEVFEKSKKSRKWSFISLILGIISILLCGTGIVGIIVGIAAVVFAAVSRFSLGYFDKMAVAGIISGIFGIVFGGAVIVFELLAEKIA